MLVQHLCGGLEPGKVAGALAVVRHCLNVDPIRQQQPDDVRLTEPDRPVKRRPAGPDRNRGSLGRIDLCTGVEKQSGCLLLARGSSAVKQRPAPGVIAPLGQVGLILQLGLQIGNPAQADGRKDIGFRPVSKQELSHIPVAVGERCV